MIGRAIGRYSIHAVVGRGGMATVYLARQTGAAGFARLVAVKALHSFLVAEADFVKMFIDEARLAARIRHPNVVATIDVVEVEGELLQVLEWVEGESLARIAPTSTSRDRKLVPIAIAASVICGVLNGLHAAHEAKDERGKPLGIVHRDVSPQNVMVGASDGIARVLDFGIAKAANRLHTTKDGAIRGKLCYMPAEQLEGKPATRANDIYATGVMLWELLTGLPMIEQADEAAIVTQVLTGIVEPPSVHRREIPAALDDLVMRALERDPTKRFASAREMALALEASVPLATSFAVSEWVQANAAEGLAYRASLVASIESDALPRLTRPSVPTQLDLAQAAAAAPAVENGTETVVLEPAAVAVALPADSASSGPDAVISDVPKERREGRGLWRYAVPTALGGGLLIALIAASSTWAKPTPTSAGLVSVAVSEPSPSTPPSAAPSSAPIADPPKETPPTSTSAPQKGLASSKTPPPIKPAKPMASAPPPAVTAPASDLAPRSPSSNENPLNKWP